MDADIVNILNYTLFKGATVQFQDLETADQRAAEMRSMPMVKQMWPNTLLELPKDEVVWAGHPSKRRHILGRTPGIKDTFSPHVMTQVDSLRAKGITGKGVKIAVVDSGVSRTLRVL